MSDSATRQDLLVWDVGRVFGGTGRLSTLQWVLDERALAESPEAWVES